MGTWQSRAALLALLGLYALLAVPTLWDPPLGRDSWRETDVLMVGRNFCREEAPLWRPRVDQRPGGEGVTGMEFPLLNFVTGKLWCAGLDHVAVSRTVGLSFALVAITALWGLSRTWLGESSALFAACAFAFSPLLLYYGRSVQPDVPALALALSSLWVLRRALVESPRPPAPYLFAAALMALAVLIKLPVIVFGLPALVMVTARFGVRGSLRRPWLALFPLVALLPAFFWYRHARALQEASGLYVFRLGQSWEELAAAWTDPRFYQLVFLQKPFDVYAFPLVSVLAVLAVLGRVGGAALRRRSPGWLGALALATVGYFFLTGHAGSHHDYYGIMAVPSLALLAGAAVQEGMERWPTARWPKVAVGVLLAGAVGYGLLRSQGFFPRPDAMRPHLEARAVIDPRHAPWVPVLLFSNVDPTLLWSLDRKGRVAPPEALPWFEALAKRPPLLVVDRARVKDAEREALEARFAQAGYARVVLNERIAAWAR